MGDDAVREDERDAEHEVARTPVAIRTRAEQVAGNRRADRWVARRVEREHLPVLGQPLVQRGEANPRLDGGGEIAGLVLEDAIEVARVDEDVSARRSIETRSPWAAARRKTSAACSIVSGSVTLRKACLLERMSTIRARDLAAQPRVGNTFPGLERPTGSNARRSRSIASRSLGPNMSGIEHALSTPIPCSPVSEPPASMHASRMATARLLRALGLAGHAGVVEHERVQVAVARVEDVADAQAVLALQLGDPAQHLGEPGARDDPVLDVVVAADAAHRGEGRLAPLPEERALGVVGGRANLHAPGGPADLFDGGQILLDLDVRCRPARR